LLGLRSVIDRTEKNVLVGIGLGNGAGDYSHLCRQASVLGGNASQWVAFCSGWYFGRLCFSLSLTRAGHETKNTSGGGKLSAFPSAPYLYRRTHWSGPVLRLGTGGQDQHTKLWAGTFAGEARRPCLLDPHGACLLLQPACGLSVD